MFWKKDKPKVPADAEKCGKALFHVLADGLKRGDRIRTEDLITAAASITGERCIEAAGDFSPRKHKFAPGSRVFSDKVNELLAGNSSDGVEAVPAESVVGVLRDKVLAAGYAESDLPSLKLIFERFAANVGKTSDWGKVPLSVPDGNRPLILPLQVAYETRSTVDRLFDPLTDPQAKLRAAVLTLSQVLIAVQQTIDKKIALLLALETVNGMAKTAPMTDEAMAAAKKKGGGQ
jgi:hypothetical protein